MPRFEDIDEDSPLYAGPPALSASINDNISPSSIAPPKLPTPAYHPNINRPYIPQPNHGTLNPKPSTETIANTMQAFQNADVGVDQFKMVKSGSANFRDPTGGNNYYDRYNTVGMRDVYDKLGFSPFRDNDEIYNKHASLWDDYQRAGYQSFQNAKVAFFQDHFGKLSDRDAAKEQQRAMAIGTSTKGGAGGWGANAALNLGYTFGVMGELAVEEIALAAAEVGLIAATGATFGGTAPLLAANTGIMGARGVRAFSKVKGAWKMASSMRKSLASLKDASKARTFFKNAANFINPLENVTKFGKQAKGAWGTATNLERMAHVTRGAGAFYSDVQQMRLAYGEGALEGGHVQLEKEQEFYDSFKAEHGRIPNKEEATKIRTLAQQAGEATAVVNMPFIMYSNKLLFDGLVRPKKPMMDIFAVKGKDILFDPKKAIMETYSKMPGWFAKKMHYVRNPKMIAQQLKKYTTSNSPEGIQELGQEVISGTAGDYYTSQFEGNSERGSLYGFIGDNLKEQASIEGFETFMSGFLIPAMIGPVTNNIHHIKNPKQTFSTLSMRFTDPKQWKTLKDKRDIHINETVEKLNKFYADPTAYLSSDLNNMQLQGAARQGEEDAEKAGDTKTLHDIKDASTMDHVITALEMGRYDTTMERLAEMKNLSAEDIAESWPHLTQAEFNTKIDKNIERGNKIKARWDYSQERMKNPFEPEKMKKGSQERGLAEINKVAWNNSRNELVYSQVTFDRALERHESILQSAYKDSGLTNTPQSSVNVLFDTKARDSEIRILKGEVESLQGEISSDQVKVKKEKEKTLEYLKAYEEALFAGEANTLDEAMPQENVEAIKNAFDNYITHTGKVHGDYVQADKMTTTFQKVMDANILKDRAQSAISAVNILLDPKGHNANFERQVRIATQLEANKKNEIKKSLDEYVKSMDKNDMLNELYEAGMFFNPEDLLKLQDEGIVPDTFYSVEKVGEEIAANSEMYSKAITILRKYLKSGSLTNINTGKSTDIYNQNIRDKAERDKRTFADIGKQFGFDPDAPETKVPLVEVLQIIMDSKYSTAREKELAKKLMEISDKNQFVSFVNNSTVAGSYSEITQTVIDPRWNSHDYKQGVAGAPIEAVILKQEMHRIASEAVAKDAEFKAEMRELMIEAKTKYDMLKSEDKAGLIDSNKREFEGFMTVEGFVAEAMANEKFQSFLGTVTSNADNTIQTGWKAFVDKVLRRIALMLHGTPSGTVLNTAMNLITAKIDSMYSSIAPQASSKSSTAEKKVKKNSISNKTSIAELRSKHPAFAEAMVNMYKDENAARDMRGNDLLDDDYLEKSPDEIFKSTAFIGWWKSADFKKKEDAIKTYNESAKAETETEAETATFSKENITDEEFEEFKLNGFVSRLRIITIAEKKKNKETLSENETKMHDAKLDEITQYINDSIAEVPKHINRAMQTKLRALGYKKSTKYDKNNKIVTKGWDAMSTTEAWKIVYQGLTRAERTEVELADQAEVRADLAKQRAEIRARVQEEINSAETLEQVYAVKTALLAELSNDTLLASAAGYTSAELDNLIEVKIDELAFSVTFDKVTEGTRVVLNDGQNTLAEVISKDETGKFLVVAPLSDLSKEEYIKEDEMEEKVKYIESDALQQAEIEEESEISEEDNETSNESLENGIELASDPDTIKKNYEAADEGNSWENDINNC